MILPPIPDNEESRLEALYRYNILDTEREKAFDEIVELASYICNTPVSLITLIDKDRQYHKAWRGFEAHDTTREAAFCSYTILQNDIMEVEDTDQDIRFSQNPSVLNDPHIKFYAGAPLTTSDGYNLGSLCVIDQKPNSLTDQQKRALKLLSNRVMSELELRLQSEKEHERLTVMENINEFKDNLISILAHDLRAPLNSIYSTLDLLDKQLINAEELSQLVPLLKTETTNTSDLLNNLLIYAKNSLNNIHTLKEQFEASSIVEDTIELYHETAHRKGVALTFEAAKARIYGDRELIKMALRNLVNNGIKFCSTGDRVTVSLSSSEGQTTISVSDSGQGMDPEKLEAIIAGTNRESSPGTSQETGVGLGFILIRDSILAQGGHITATSERGAGSTFNLVVPSEKP